MLPIDTSLTPFALTQKNKTNKPKDNEMPPVKHSPYYRINGLKAKDPSDTTTRLQRAVINQEMHRLIHSGLGFDFSKTRISNPRDPFEQEANSIANQVLRKSGLAPTRYAEPDEMEAEMLQRKSEHAFEPVNAKVHPDGSLARRRITPDQSGSSGLLSIVHEVLRMPGLPMDNDVRIFMESRMGHDFGQVRIHTDAKAGESAEAVSAQAYTVGPDVVFGAGRYDPASDRGKYLIAHELAHVVQQQTQIAKKGTLIQRAPLKDELDQELKAWAEKNDKSIDLNNPDYAFNLQEFAWNLIAVPSNSVPIPKPKDKKGLQAWQKKFQKAQLLAGMILKGGKNVVQKEDRAALILNLIAQAGISEKEVVALTKQMTDASQIEFVYSSILDRAQSADPESLTTITEFFIKEKGKTSNPIIEKLTDSSGSFEKNLSNAQLNALLKPLITSYEKDAMITSMLSEVLIHKPAYRKVFSDWMWKEGKEEFLFKILESEYFVEPEYGPTVFPEVGELELEKDMPWVYANKQKYYVGYLVQLGKDTGVDIDKPKDLKFTTVRKWLDDHTEKIGEALAKKYPADPDQWIKVYGQLADIFFYHVSGRNIKPDLGGKLAKLEPGAPNRMRLKADCDVLATYAMRYFSGIQNPTNPALMRFEPVGYMAIAPMGHEGHAVALMRRDGKYYVISNKQVFPTSVVGDVKDPKKEDGIKEMKRIGFGVYTPKPDKYNIYYADALARGAMPKALANTEESARRKDLEP